MRRSSCVVLAATAALATLSGCKGEEAPVGAPAASSVAPPAPPPAALPFQEAPPDPERARLGDIGAWLAGSDAEAVVVADVDLGLALHRRLRRGGRNTAASPLLASDALSWTAAGTPDAPPPHEARALLRTHASLAARLGGVRLDLACGLWAQAGAPLPDAIAEAGRRWYGAEPQSVDFARDPAGARLLIGDWIARATRGRAREALPPEAFSDRTSAALVVAAGIAGPFYERFDVAATAPAPFCLPGRGTVAAPTMHRIGTVIYYEDEELQIVTLPYGSDGGLELVVVLPAARDGLARLERRLDAAVLGRLLAARWEAAVDLALPRFAIDATGSLTRELAALGAGRAFAAGADAYQAVVVAVDEEGALPPEGVAAQGATARAPRRFAAAHPFLFLVFDVATGEPLIVGAVENPAPDAPVIRGACPVRPPQPPLPVCQRGRVRASVVLERPEVRGGLSAEVVRRIVSRHRNELKFCFERQLAQQPDLDGGEVRVEFTIAGSGAVQSAAILTSELRSPAVDECVAMAFRRWTFPQPEGGAPARARIALGFGCEPRN